MPKVAIYGAGTSSNPNISANPVGGMPGGYSAAIGTTSSLGGGGGRLKISVYILP